MKKNNKNLKYIVLFVFILYLGIIFRVKTSSASNLPTFSSQELSQYNGTDLDKPVYIAYEGMVYDVSPGRNEFYNLNKPYHFLAGRDSTKELNFAGGSIIRSKYTIIGTFK